MKRAFFGAALLGSTLGLSLAACVVEQPPLRCTVPNGFTNNMQLRLTPAEGQTLTGACANLETLTIGMDQYGSSDGSTLKLALIALPIGKLSGPHDGGVTGEDVAVADYMDEVPESGLCTAAETSEARIHVPAQTGPGGDVIRPARELAVKFENIEIYSTPEIPGTQARMDVLWEEDGCAGRYQAIGVYPPIRCAGIDGLADDRLCDPATEPTSEERKAGIIPGCRDLGPMNECLNPAFVMRCDPQTLFCFPEAFGRLKE